MRRAMMMVELLVSIALLALVMLGGAQWLNVAASAQRGVTDQTAWRHAALQALTLLEDSIRAGDRPDAEPLERVGVIDDRLEIASRSMAGDGGPEFQSYIHDEATKWLMVQVQDRDRRNTTRPILPDVQAVTIEIDEEFLILDVEFVSTAGETVSRRIRL